MILLYLKLPIMEMGAKDNLCVMIDKIFDSFVSYSGKIVDGKRGMGLGLAICKAIINAHGGEITAGKSPEGGALFSFTLPL